MIATDHAPHTMEEKQKPYLQSPSGLPLIQHSLSLMLDFYHKGELSLEFIVNKMCHAPAELFRIKDRGYVEEGCFADLAVVDITSNLNINKSNILYKCGWSPLENFDLKGKVISTMCNGKWVFQNEKITGIKSGERLQFKVS